MERWIERGGIGLKGEEKGTKIIDRGIEIDPIGVEMFTFDG